MEYWGVTDRGCVRPENQDSFAVKRLQDANGGELIAAVVCDGMGGARAGNVASRLGVDRFIESIAEQLTDFSEGNSVLPLAADEANRLVYEKANSDPECAGMGTTLVACLSNGKEALVANVGDSRCYLIRSDGIRQITKDHSLVEDMVDRGEIDRAEAWLHPRRNYITRALGTDEEIACDLFRVELEAGDALLLCSDGLSGVVNSQELLFELLYGGDRENCVDRMLAIALERNAPDNVTAVLLSCTEPEPASAVEEG